MPGSEGIVEDVEQAEVEAKKIGYPLLIKASAGGGGRGMRVVLEPEQLAAQFEAASNEAGSAFGVPDVYMERYVLEPRHVEFQVMGDRHGNLVHLFERECSIQRRHQKLLEECPSTALDADLRARMAEQAIRAARTVNYDNAGTVEFLLDPSGEFFFIEMNTRIQVEHPVTEAVTGVDLVKEQLRIAAGEPMSVPKRRRVQPRGHAIELRINAEDPLSFAPSPGLVTHLALPGGPGVRVDTHLYSGYTVPPYYDSLVAKLVVHGMSRDEAIVRCQRALEMLRVDGVRTSIDLHRRILADPDFASGDIHTHFMERYQTEARR